MEKKRVLIFKSLASGEADLRSQSLRQIKFWYSAKCVQETGSEKKDGLSNL